MANDKGAEGGAQADQHEAILIFRMVGVIDEERILVDEDGFRFMNETPCLRRLA